MTIDKELNKLKKDELVSIIIDTLDMHNIKLELNKKYINSDVLKEMKVPTRMIVEKYKQQSKCLIQAGKYYDKGCAILNTKYTKDK